MREEWPKAVMSSPFVKTGFGVYLHYHSKLKVRLHYVPLKLSHSNFNLVISKPYRTYPNGKFGFENLWLSTLRWVVGHFKLYSKLISSVTPRLSGSGETRSDLSKV